MARTPFLLACLLLSASLAVPGAAADHDIIKACEQTPPATDPDFYCIAEHAVEDAFHDAHVLLGCLLGYNPYTDGLDRVVACL